MKDYAYKPGDPEFRREEFMKWEAERVRHGGREYGTFEKSVGIVGVALFLIAAFFFALFITNGTYL